MFVNQLSIGEISEDDDVAAAAEIAKSEDAPKQSAAAGFAIMFVTTLWQLLDNPLHRRNIS